MLTRKIIDKLTQWKNDAHHKSLVIKGARQVGKTYAVNEFGAANYERVISLNFEEHPEYRTIFATDHSADAIYAQLSLFFPGAEFAQRKTLLFLDEIQSCPDAITSLKFLTIDGRADVIASGSLLGTSYKDVSSYPVGYVDHMEMHSLDFEEFLWASGISESTVEYVRGFLIGVRKSRTLCSNE